MVITAALDSARAALRGGAGPRVYGRRDRAPAVAFLVTLARSDGDLLIPLCAGRNLVGRRSYWPAPDVVEQGQWVVECGSGFAEVWDAASTNLSVLLPGAMVDGVDLGIMLKEFQRLFTLPGAIPLPHPNEPHERYRYPLAEGDVLRGCYAAFAFGWLDPDVSLRAGRAGPLA